MTGPTDAQRTGMIRSAVTISRSILSRYPFQGRGFSDATIDALVAAGVEIPEQLLSMPERTIAAIPGLGKARLAEVRAYVLRYRP